jgi:chemotaxis protein CheC
MNFELTPLEQDALTEVFNMGIGRAASALNKMVADEVHLNVPEVIIIPHKQAADYILSRVDGKVTAIRQQVEGDFSGNALLLFPSRNSLQLVRTLLRDQVPLSSLTELEQEALLEVGNVMLNACFGTITNLLQLKVKISLPVLEQGEVSDVVKLSGGDSWALMLQVHFSLPTQDISGFVSFILDVISMQHLKQSLQRFVGQIGQ